MINERGRHISGLIQRLRKQLCGAQVGFGQGKKDELLAVIVVAGALVVCWIVLRDQRLKRQGRTSGQDGRGGR
jgi:hypothetical protein